MSQNDYFQNAIEYILKNLNETGFKMLKNGTIKKKVGDLSLEIITQRSRNNPNVLLHLSASIFNKNKVQLYQLLFTVPQSRAIYIPFYIKQKTLNFEALDRIIKDLNDHFVEPTHLLHENPKELFKNTNYQPEIRSEDYRYRIYLSKSLYEHFATEEELKLFEENYIEYKSLENEIKRDTEEYLYYISNIVPNDFLLKNAKKYSNEKLLEILLFAYHFAKEENDHDRFAIRYEYIKNRKSTNEELFVLVFYFIIVSGMESKILARLKEESNIDFVFQKKPPLFSV